MPVNIQIALKGRPDIRAGIQEVRPEQPRKGVIRIVEILRTEDRDPRRHLLPGQAAVVVQHIDRAAMANTRGKAQIVGIGSRRKVFRGDGAGEVFSSPVK